MPDGRGTSGEEGTLASSELGAAPAPEVMGVFCFILNVGDGESALIPFKALALKSNIQILFVCIYLQEARDVLE